MCCQRTRGGALHDCKAALSSVLNTQRLFLYRGRGQSPRGGHADGGAGAVVERASMAAKLAGQERENHQLLERLASPFTILSM